MVDRVADTHERLDILVNNAGINRDGLLLRMSDEDFDQVIQVNLRSAFVTCRAAARPMMRNRYGRIINIASVTGIRGNPGQANYAAAKAGIAALTLNQAAELGRYGIRVNAVNPAAGSNEMLQPLLPDIDVEAMRDAQEKHDPPPIGRRGRVEDVAASVAFLASDDSAFYNGADFDLDGGITAGMRVPGDIPGTPRRHA